MSKKNVFIMSICVIAVMVIILYTVGIIRLPIKTSGDNVPEAERLKSVIEERFPTDVIIVGDDIEFENDLAHRVINGISEVNLKSDKSYRVIVINDLYNKVTLDEAEIEYLKKLINVEGNYIIYLGEKYSKTFNDNENGYIEVEDNYFYSYYRNGRRISGSIGAWRKTEMELINDNKYLLGDVLMSEIEKYLMNMN